MAQYAGESLAKKVARVRLYKRAREALKFRLPSLKGIKALFLIGNTASEVGALKYILGVAPENMIGVDRDPEACKVLQNKVPGAHVVEGELVAADTYRRVGALIAPQGVHFTHLDLMGNLSGVTENIYMNWADLCALDGVCGVTYLRGRETAALKARTVNSLARTALDRLGRGKSKMFAPDEHRAMAHYWALQLGPIIRFLATNGQLSLDEITDRLMRGDVELVRAIQKHSENTLGAFVPIATYAYRAEVSPMGCLLAQRLTRAAASTPHYEKFMLGGGRLSSSSLKKDPMEDLLLEADSLAKEFTNAQVAEILDVSTGTLAAWRAHRTMGTYEAA